ncbi:MAG: hypothetical protein QM743_11670 [Chitinophagaceae bacterium]
MNYKVTFVHMQDFEQRWIQVESFLVERFGKKPDLEGTLYLIGINELGAFPETKNFTKEQKQDLMHIAVCKLLSQVGIFVLDKYDEEGWPHYIPTGIEAPEAMKDQEQLLKECIIRYFEQ